MTEREKVIKGLECCSAYDYRCNDCPYQDDGGAEDDCYSDELYADALALLKAQEPRLLTYEDFNNNPAVDSKGRLPAWVEHNWKLGPPLVDDGYSTITKEEMENWDKSFVRWWTSRPTDEQREAVKWDG